MKHHLVPFGVGPRMCIGLNVAWSESYTVAAMIYSRYEMSLADDLRRKCEGEMGEIERDERKLVRIGVRRVGSCWCGFLIRRNETATVAVCVGELEHLDFILRFRSLAIW